MTVTATPSPGSRPASRRCSAASAISSSPSTTSPLRSTASTRSPSPSKAKATSKSRARSRERLDVGRAAAVVDVAAVGLDRHRLHVGAEPAEDLGRDAVGGAVGAVEQHARAAQVEVLEAQLELAQVVAGGAVQLADDAGGVAGGAAVRSTSASIRASCVVGELRAVGAEELDAVVPVGVVRGGDHGRQVEAVAARRAGRRPASAARRRAARARRPRPRPSASARLEHLARLARVAHDQHLRRRRPARARPRRGRARRQLGREELAGDAAHAVGAEQLGQAASAWRTAGACGPS